MAAALGAGIWTYQRYAERYPATDDAYISANVVHVAPEVSGEVIGVHVANQEHVASGDKLVTIEAAPYPYAVEHFHGRVESGCRPARKGRNQFGRDLRPRPPPRGWPPCAVIRL